MIGPKQVKRGTDPDLPGNLLNPDRLPGLSARASSEVAVLI